MANKYLEVGTSNSTQTESGESGIANAIGENVGVLTTKVEKSQTQKGESGVASSSGNEARALSVADNQQTETLHIVESAEAIGNTETREQVANEETSQNIRGESRSGEIQVEKKVLGEQQKFAGQYLGSPKQAEGFERSAGEKNIVNTITVEEVKRLIKEFCGKIDLTDYYTKEQIDAILTTIKKNAFMLVDTTEYPSLAEFLESEGEEGYVYLYPADLSDSSKGYKQYIWENNAWLYIGDTLIDLSNYYTKAQTDQLLNEKVGTRLLNVDIYAPVGDSTTLSGIEVQIKDENDNLLLTGTYNGETLKFFLPLYQQYKIEVVTQSVTIGGVTYFAPEITSGSSEGAIVADTNVVYRYSSTQSINSLSAVKQFLALPDIDIATKRLALVRTETNSFSVNITIKNPENNTEYTMPIYILEIDNYTKKVDGVDTTFLGAKCQFGYALPDSVAFDEREQVECESGETFQDGIFYYTATSSGVGDKVFTPLVAGTDYQNGDSIDTYKSTNNVYVFKHAWSNTQYGSGNSSTANLIRYGSNIYHESNIDKWLNGIGVDWFVASHLGDRLATWYNGKHGFKDWFDNATLSLIEDNVAYGVYERTNFELPDNKIYRMFVLPSGTEMAGSCNNNEGTITEYWKYLNGGSAGNSANANRTVKKITNISSAQNTWFRSPYRNNSYYAWLVNTNGNIYNSSACYGYAVLPTFTV